MKEEVKKKIAKAKIGWGLTRLTNLENLWEEETWENKSVSFYAVLNACLAKYGNADFNSMLDFNPYCFMELKGFGFNLIDKLAMFINPELLNSPSRCNAASDLILDKTEFEGHTYVEYGKYLELASELLKKSPADLDRFFNDLTAYNPTKVVQLGKTKIITRLSTYDNELLIAETIKAASLDTELLRVIATKTYKIQKMELDANVKLALHKAIQNTVSLICGSAGTGKTTIIKMLAKFFQFYFGTNSVTVLAPTGKAVRRITESTGLPAYTIHRFLYSPNLVKTKFVVVDEFSMVGSNLLGDLIRSCDFNNLHLVCLGDDKQLPPMGAGRPIRDILNYDSNTSLGIVTKLNKVYRQGEKSDLYDFILSVLELKPKFEKVSFIECSSEGLLKQVRLQASGYDVEEYKILAPQSVGDYGCDAINKAIQGDLFRTGGIKAFDYFVGDKVLWLKNSYAVNMQIMNGEELSVIGSNGDDILLRDFNGIDYKLDYYTHKSYFKLAYAMTVHKSQGSEYNVVIFVCTQSHIRMLTNKLIYTAITRARNRLIIIGVKDVFMKGIKHSVADNAKTLLSHFLKLR